MQEKALIALIRARCSRLSKKERGFYIVVLSCIYIQKKKGQFLPFFSFIHVKISQLFRLVKCFRQRMFQTHHSVHLLHQSAFRI